MVRCDQRQAYLDRTLSPEDQAAYVRHAHGCATCTRAMQAWAVTEAAVQDWAQVRQARPRTPGDTEALMLRARARRAPAVPMWALACAAVLLIGALAWPEPPVPAPDAPVAQTTQQPAPPPPLQVLSQAGDQAGVAGAVLEVPSEGHLLVASGEDRLGLGERSRLQRRERGGAWSLDRGTAAFDVAPRAAQDTFSVLVDDWEVVVVGTRFRVDRTQGLLVTVTEGRVEVRGPDGTWSVGAGQRFQDGELIDRVDDNVEALLRQAPEPRSEPQPIQTKTARRAVVVQVDLGELRRRLIAGDVRPVRQELLDHLDDHPRDVDAWKLLALAERKAGNAPAAAQAWLQVAELGTGSSVARAHYEAALLFQELEQHTQAVTWFRAFLADERRSNSLEAAGRLHMARSQIALGDTDAAIQQLDTIIRNHQGTSAATQARELLKKIGR